MIAFVTGSSRGIGRATALRLAEDGCDIAVHCRSAREAAEETAAAIRKRGRRALVVQGDVNVAAEAAALVQEIQRELGPIELLINNAGSTKDGLLLRLSDKDLQSVLDTNLLAAFRLIRLVLPGMLKKRAGRIVNLSSVAGLYGNAGQTNYSAAKAGLIGLTKSLAKEIGSRGITVNAVAPGLIRTDMTSVLDEKLLAEIRERIALQRFGEAEEVASVVSFLASPAASYITGQVIEVSGGLAL